MSKKMYFAVRLTALFLAFIIASGGLNAQMVLAQTRVLSEIIEDILEDSNAEEDGEAEQAEEPEDEPENETGEEKDDEDATDIEEEEDDKEDEDEKESEEELVADDTGKRVYPAYFLDTSEFSGEVLSLVHSGRNYSDMDEWERFILKDQAFVREDTMTALESYGYGIYESIPVARLMQQMELSVYDVHRMIEIYDGLDGAVYEANEFRRMLIHNFTGIPERDRTDIISFIVAGYTAEHVISTYTMALTLELPLSLLMGPQQVFSANDITLLDINTDNEIKPPLPEPPKAPLPEEEIEEEEEEDQEEDEDEGNGIPDIDDGELENDGSEEPGEDDSEGTGEPDFAEPFTSIMHSGSQPVTIAAERMVLAANIYLPLDENPEEPGENDTEEITQPEGEEEEEEKEDIEEEEEFPPNETVTEEEEEEELLSEQDILIVIDLANQYHIHPDILIDFLLQNDMNGSALRSLIRFVQRMNGIVAEEEFSMLNNSLRQRSAALPPDVRLSWQYPVSPFSYKGSYSETINLNTGALIYTDHIVSLPGRGGFDLDLALVYDSSESSNDWYWGEIIDVNVYANGRFYTNTWEQVLIPITRHIDQLKHGPRDRFFASGWTLNTTRIFTDYTTIIHGPPYQAQTAGRFVKLADGRTIEIEVKSGTAQLKNYKLSDLKFQADNFAAYPGSAFILTYADGTKEYLSQNHLVARTDRFGNVIRFVDSDNRVTITDSNNKVITIDLPSDSVNGQISITLPDSAAISYTVSGNDNILTGMPLKQLTEKRDQLGRVTRFEYTPGEFDPNFFSRASQTKQVIAPSALHRITIGKYNATISDWFGSPFEFYGEYRGPAGVEINSYNRSINNTFVFGSDYWFAARSAYYSNLTKITYPTGMYTEYVYGKSQASLHAMGHKDYYYVKERSDYALGVRYNRVSYTPGLNGNARNNFSGMSLTDTLLTELPTSYFYYMSEQNGSVTTTYKFNNKHLLAEKIAEGAGVKETSVYTYDSLDLPQTAVTTVSSSSGSYTTHERFNHDSYGNMTAYWPPLAEGGTGDEFKTSFTYDYSYNLLTGKTYKRDADTTITETYALSPDRRYVASMTRTANNTRIAMEDYTVNAAGMLSAKRSWYGSAGYLEESYTYINNTYLATKTIDGAQERYTYDELGNVVSYRDPNGNTYRYGYDLLNRLTRTENPDRAADTTPDLAADRVVNPTQTLGATAVNTTILKQGSSN